MCGTCFACKDCDIRARRSVCCKLVCQGFWVCPEPKVVLQSASLSGRNFKLSQKLYVQTWPAVMFLWICKLKCTPAKKHNKLFASFLCYQATHCSQSASGRFRAPMLSISAQLESSSQSVLSTKNDSPHRITPFFARPNALNPSRVQFVFV